MSRERIGKVAELLLEYFEQDKTFQANSIMTVPAEAYTDPDRLRAEISLIFKRVPLMLALSCEIPKPGDYKALGTVGLPVLIARDKAGVVRAFLNVCAHRWSPVVAEGYGNCVRFTCPFHGWTYSADGRLIGVTDRSKFGDFETSARGLTPLPCEERHGMIFVSLTPGISLDLDEYYGSLLKEYAFAGLQHWTLLGTRSVEGANWKITLNNFFETYHFATLHAKTVAVDFASDITHYEGFGPNMRIALVQRSIGKLREVPRAKWGEQEGQGFGFIRFFFPNVTGYVGTELAVFTQTFPGATPDKSHTTLIFLRKDPPQDDVEREQLKKMIDSSCEIDGEDFGVGLKIQTGLKSGAHDGVLYGRNERGNQYFHEWLSWYLHGDPSCPKAVM